MNVLLTSAGLETEKLRQCFINGMPISMAKVHALFIPTAAVDADAVAVLPKCMNDLLGCGIRAENIAVFDLHRRMELAELEQFHVVYLCGGSARYLLWRMNHTGFAQTLVHYIRRGGAVIGVSAGSLIFAGNLPDNLGFIPVPMSVHCSSGDKVGRLSAMPDTLRLTNTSALWIREENMEIVGE